jgi:hypothetical protein
MLDRVAIQCADVPSAGFDPRIVALSVGGLASQEPLERSESRDSPTLRAVCRGIAR